MSLLWLILFVVTMAIWLVTTLPATRATFHPVGITLIPFLAVLFGTLWAASWHGIGGLGLGCTPAPFTQGRGC